MNVEKKDRRELHVTLSVVALISDSTSRYLLLVKDRETGKWQPPAGGLQWLEDEDRIETFGEGVSREVLEETGIFLPPNLDPLVVMSLRGKDKYRMGAVYKYTLKEETKNISPRDTNEIEEVKFFNDHELVALLRQENGINRPNFNRGLIAWWLRNEHRDSWDIYKGDKMHDEKLNEKYLKEWEDAKISPWD